MKKINRIYHGAHKNTICRNTVLHVPFDGNVDPLIGRVRPYKTFEGKFTPSKTGESLVQTDIETNFIYDLESTIKDEVTIDFFLDFDSIFSTGLSYYPYVFCLYDHLGASDMYLAFYYGDGSFYFSARSNTVAGDQLKMSKITGKHFVRCIYSKKQNHLIVYLDGKELARKDSITTDSFNMNCITLGNRYDLTPERKCALVELSNLRVVNDNLGDTFDYLVDHQEEDLKAIVNKLTKQIPERTDVASSFIREVRVPPYSTTSPTKDYDTSIYIDGMNPCKHDSSICVKSAISWASGSQIMIRDLESFVITGVLDYNTALCNVTKYISGATQGSKTVLIEVDNTSKLTLNDVLKLQLNNTAQSPNEFTVSKIEGNILTLTVNTTLGSNIEELIVGGKLFEITTSSSVPTVVTKEGKTVVGTWSGLGTRKAIFTLGENSDLAGKDLYITYCINTFRGRSLYNVNSYYCQPQEYLGGYDEFGNELVPVESITITDDFSGKIAHDTNHVKHYAKFSYSAQRPNNPSEFVNEVSNHPLRNYSHLSKLDNNDYVLNCTPSDTGAPKLLCAFNIIDIIERKLGYEIPSRDKIQWIKDHVKETCKINVYGYGMNGDTPSLKFFLWNIDTQAWDSVTNPGTALNKKTKFVSTTNQLSRRIDTNGYYYMMVLTDKHTTLESKIVIDYVNIEISLRIPTGYTALWVKDTYAKGVPCNPILCNPVTKSVTRMIPNNELFTLDISASNPNLGTTSSAFFGTLRTSDKYLCDTKNIITSLGSGSDIAHTDLVAFKTTSSYGGALGHALQNYYPSYVFCSEPVGKSGRFYASSKDSYCYIREIPNELGFRDNPVNCFLSEHLDSQIQANNFALLSSFLYKSGLSKIKLGIVASIFKDGKLLTQKFVTCDLVNSPLIL